MNLLYTLTWHDPGAEAGARQMYAELRSAVANGSRFPFDCPYEIGLAQSRSSAVSEWAVAVLALRGVLLDDSARAETVNRLENWFRQVDASETRGGYSRTADHLKLSSELGLGYELIDSFGTFVGEPEPETPAKTGGAPEQKPAETSTPLESVPEKGAARVTEAPSRPIHTPAVESSETKAASTELPLSPPPSPVKGAGVRGNSALTCLGAGLAGTGLFVGVAGLLIGLLFVIAQFGQESDIGTIEFLIIMACFPLAAMLIGGILLGFGIYLVWRVRKNMPFKPG